MIFQNDLNYYEVLEVKSDASALDIRNAYLRVKQAYKKDNLALYSLMDDSETDEMLQKVEEAFQVLSDPELRRDYDERHGLLSSIEKKIISIDRVPPMDSGDETDLLVPPSTDFVPGGSTAERRGELPSRRTADLQTISSLTNAMDTLEAEIQNELEWKGSFLRKIREIKRYSLDDMANQTKISKTYLTAIEEEAFAKLPAAVFVRGFITQISKVLKLPSDKVALAYMTRYKHGA